MFLDIDKKPKNSIAAIDDSGKRLTYGELVDDCKVISEGLDQRELVFCLCKNNCDSLAGYISFYENKDVVLLLSADMDCDLLDNLISIYKPAYLWLPSSLAPRYDYETFKIYHSYILAKTGYESCELNNDLSFLMMTSGSTGSPKLVRHKYGNMEISAMNVAKVFNWSSDERAICNLPMNYTMGLNVINSHIFVGATILLTEYDMLNSMFWTFIKENKGTNITGAPYSYKISQKLHFKNMDLPYLRTLAQGGGRMDDVEFKELAEYAYSAGIRFFATYGTTETSARITYLTPELSTSKCGSIGKAIEGGTLLIVNENGDEIKEKIAEGELVYRGPNVTLGYAECRSDLNAGDHFNGGYYTGDIVKRDLEGLYYIIGRKKRFLKLYGKRINLDQCEKLIKEKFGIECVCSGTDQLIEIYLIDKSSAIDIIKYLSFKIGIRYNAINVNNVSEIPRNASGKVIYQRLS